jgi:hypothetical protein
MPELHPQTRFPALGCRADVPAAALEQVSLLPRQSSGGASRWTGFKMLV